MLTCERAGSQPPSLAQNLQSLEPEPIEQPVDVKSDRILKEADNIEARAHAEAEDLRRRAEEIEYDAARAAAAMRLSVGVRAVRLAPVPRPPPRKPNTPRAAARAPSSSDSESSVISECSPTASPSPPPRLSTGPAGVSPIRLKCLTKPQASSPDSDSEPRPSAESELDSERHSEGDGTQSGTNAGASDPLPQSQKGVFFARHDDEEEDRPGTIHATKSVQRYSLPVLTCSTPPSDVKESDDTDKHSDASKILPVNGLGHYIVTQPPLNSPGLGLGRPAGPPPLLRSPRKKNLNLKVRIMIRHDNHII